MQQLHRLFGIVYRLLNQKMTTAKELAEHFEVSPRTILRDIDTLSNSGIPIYTAQGKGGGIAILPHHVFSKVLLTQEDKNQILFALQSVAFSEDIEAKLTLNKLTALFNSKERSWIDVDFSRWGNNQSDKARFETLKNAIINNRMIHFDYPDRQGEICHRRAYPLKLVFKSKAWYLQAFCLFKHCYRTFRIHRMMSIESLDETFDHDTYSAPAIETFNKGTLPMIDLALLFTPSTAGWLFDEFDSNNIIKNPDGSFLVSISLPEDPWLYHFLLSFGRQVKVISPKHIKANLITEIDKLKNHYSKDII